MSIEIEFGHYQWYAENTREGARESVALCLYASGYSMTRIGNAIGLNHQKAGRAIKRQALFELERQRVERVEEVAQAVRLQFLYTLFKQNAL
jgi:transposase-like protein